MSGKTINTSKAAWHQSMNFNIESTRTKKQQ
jgi:hypothetical protein